jgi:hypothetical protein
MVSLSDQSSHNNYQAMEMPILLDPILLRAARRIYRTYCVLHAKLHTPPAGVAIHRDSHRGQLIFKTRPILLPGECFVPLKQIESEIS